MAAAGRSSVELCRALLSASTGRDVIDDVTDHVTFSAKQQLQKNKLTETRAGTSAVHEAARAGSLRVLQVSVRQWRRGRRRGGHLLPLLLKFWTVGQLPENLFRVENFFIKNAKFEANSHVGKSLHGTIAISSTRNCFGRKVAGACRTIATFCPVYLFILRHR